MGDPNSFPESNLYCPIIQDGFPYPFTAVRTESLQVPQETQTTPTESVIPSQNAFIAPHQIPSSNVITMSEQASSPSTVPNLLRFPCKARGIDSKHNAENAFIQVPPLVEHGHILVCSNLACASSGRRFRWCSVCMVPAAKRNFMKRHSHGLITSSRFSTENGNDNSQSNNKSGIGTVATTEIPQKRSSDNLTDFSPSKKRRVSLQEQDFSGYELTSV